MRSRVWIAAAGLLLCAAAHGGAREEDAWQRGAPMPGAKWIMQASPALVEATLNKQAESARTGRRPLVLVETSAYTYLPAENHSVTVSIDPNGFTGAATLYLYRQNRVTGAREYYSASARALGAEQRDLFGSSESPTALVVPTLTNFQLFGAGGALGPAQLPQPVGRYQWVMEVRDVAGRTVLSRGNAMYAYVAAVQQVTASITGNTTFSSNNAYLLTAPIFVRAGATLTIQPGTVVFGQKATRGTLIVERGGLLMAAGTAMQPIIMTTDQPIGSRARGDWGGLVLNGAAPINAPGGQATGEGDTGVYGGTNAADSSGALRYVRVEFAGIEFSPENELNGIAFQGVGNGTLVDHVQVHFNQDDGVEMFGGTVNLKYVLLTGIRDDSIDWVRGWTGSLQFAVGVHSGDDADNGIEADNEDDNNDLTPRSNPNVYNVTLIGAPSGGSAESDDAVVLREGTAGKIHNSIFAYFNEVHVAIRDPATFTQASSGELVVDNNIFWMNTEEWDTTSGAINADGQATRTFITQTMRNNRIVDPRLALVPAPAGGRRFPLVPDVEPLAGSPALDVRFVKTPPDNGFLDTTVDFLGGVRPGDNWTLTGWALFATD